MLIKRYGWVCWYCGAEIDNKTAQVDHIVPKSKGGGHEKDNLALSCKRCNLAKLDTSLTSFVRWLGWVKSKEAKIAPVIQEKVIEVNIEWDDNHKGEEKLIQARVKELLSEVDVEWLEEAK